MGTLYVFDHDGNRLHPPPSGEGDPGSGGGSDDLTGMPTSEDATWRSPDGATDPDGPDEPSLPDEFTLRYGVNDAGAVLECVVNGVETNSARERAIVRYETGSTNGVFPEFVGAVEAELVERRGWMIGAVENPRNPGYVFQRLRDAAAGTDPTPQQLPPDPDVVRALLEAGETLTVRVRDFSVAGDLILRYGNAGCNVSVAESSPLGEQPTGLVVVQDDSVDGAVALADDARERVEEEKRRRSLAAIARGVDGLADLDVEPAEAAAALQDRVARRYDGIEVLGPERQREVSKLAGRVESLERETEELRERNRQLRERNESLRSERSAAGSDAAGQARSTDGGVPASDTKGVASAGATAGGSGGTADDAGIGGGDSRKWRRIAWVVAIVLSIVLLVAMAL